MGLRPGTRGQLNVTTSAEVSSSIAELQAITLWIQQQTCGLSLSGEKRAHLVYRCLDLVIEHQTGIAVLADQPCWGPAFALLRVITEGFVRGLWLAYCATDAQLKRFEKRGPDGTFAQQIAAVEAANGVIGGTLSRMHKTSWRMFNDLTHIGYQHLVRRSGPGVTGPSYKDVEIIAALRYASALGLLATVALADLSGNRDVALAVKAKIDSFAATHALSAIAP